MSTEIERRLKAIEAKVITGTPCRHPLPIVHSEKEAEEMVGILDQCPKCSRPSFGQRILYIRSPKPGDHRE